MELRHLRCFIVLADGRRQLTWPVGQVNCRRPPSGAPACRAPPACLRPTRSSIDPSDPPGARARVRGRSASTACAGSPPAGGRSPGGSSPPGPVPCEAGILLTPLAPGLLLGQGEVPHLAAYTCSPFSAPERNGKTGSPSAYHLPAKMYEESVAEADGPAALWCCGKMGSRFACL